MRRLRQNLWPQRVVVNTDNWQDVTPIETWLGQNVGGFKQHWNVVYLFNQTHYYFRQEQHATFFALRWL